MIRVTLQFLLGLSLLLVVFGCASPLPAPTPTSVAVVEVPSATATPAPTVAPSPTTSATPSASATKSPTASATPTATAADTATATRTRTPVPSATASSTSAPTVAKPTATPTPEPTQTPKPTATSTPVPTVEPSPTATPTVAPVVKRAFLGYYVPYDSSSWQSLTAQAANLDYVALQVATLDYCGNVSAHDDRTLLNFAQSRGLPVLASLFTSKESLNHSILTNPASADNAVRQLTAWVVEAGYDGLDIDLEAVPADDRPALTAFVARVSEALRAQGKLVTMAVPAKTREVTTGWAGAYDYAALGPHLDLLIIMSYAYSTSSGAPGSTAPHDWVSRVAAYTTSQVPAEKVLLGVGLWGYDWNTTSGGRARSLRYPQAETLAAAYGATIGIDPTTRSAKFEYTAMPGDPLPYQESLTPVNHEIVERKPGPCSLNPATPTPTTRTPTPTPMPTGPQQHVVWLENAASAGIRLDIAAQYGVGGAAGWRLGHEDPAVWPRIAAWRFAE